MSSSLNSTLRDLFYLLQYKTCKQRQLPEHYIRRQQQWLQRERRESSAWDCSVGLYCNCVTHNRQQTICHCTDVTVCKTMSLFSHRLVSLDDCREADKKLLAFERFYRRLLNWKDRSYRDLQKWLHGRIQLPKNMLSTSVMQVHCDENGWSYDHIVFFENNSVSRDFLCYLWWLNSRRSPLTQFC